VKSEHKCYRTEHKCEFCQKKFTTSTSYYRHKRKFCKRKKQIDEILKPPLSLLFITNFGDEDWNEMSEEELDEIFDKEKRRVVGNIYGEMFMHIHIDKEEYMNVFMPYDKCSKIYVIKNDKWVSTNLHDVVKVTMYKQQKLLIDYYSKKIEEGKLVKNSEAYLMLRRCISEAVDNPHTLRETKRTVKNILFNNREKIKRYHGTIKVEDDE